MTIPFESADAVMKHAIELAWLGQGYVEPNPMVGSVLVDERLRLLGEGFHQRFGGPHAEVNALADFAIRYPDEAERRRLLESATLYVTLEPCCHHGKTPPCSQLLIRSGVRRVVVALQDPFPRVSGGGLRELLEAGIEVSVGLLADEVARLNAPFVTLMTKRRPYVHAKWAMTLDGKLATRERDSKWISSEASRAIVHQLRGRMDAILVGSGTAAADDPLLTARPPGPRTPLRIVLDSRGELTLSSQLVRTAREIPLLVAVSQNASEANIANLRAAGAEVLVLCSGDRSSNATPNQPDVAELLAELGRRSLTNLLVEGGSEVLGSFCDVQLIDEAHVFIASKIAGGRDAISPVGGHGVALMSLAQRLSNPEIQIIEHDVYVRGMIERR